MRIAKRTLSVKKSELQELFNIPETVEITGVRTGSDGSIEFQLVSAGEVFVGGTQVTVFQNEGYNTYRRIGLSTLHSLQGDMARNFLDRDYSKIQGELPASSLSPLVSTEGLSMVDTNEVIIPATKFALADNVTLVNGVTPATCVTTSAFEDTESDKKEK